MLLAEEIDKLGNKIEIYHSKLSFSPAYSFFLRQQADLIDSNHIFPCTFLINLVVPDFKTIF